MSNEMLSKKFKRSDFISDLDCKSMPEKRSKEIIDRAKTKLLPILQELRDFLGDWVKVNCSYRNEQNNAEVGGEKLSHHRYFQDKCAVDFTCKNISAAWLWLKSNRKRFCYAYWDKKKNFIHLSGLTKTDHLGRIGAMWVFENGENIYE